MALALLAGRPIVEGYFTMTRIGVWHGDFLVDRADLLPSGQSQLVFEKGQTFNVAPIRQAIFADYLRCRIVSGAGTLYSTQIKPRYWVGTSGTIPLSVPLNYILSQCGETLSKQADNSVLNQQLVSWTCVPQSGSAAIRSLIKGFATSWRSQQDGSIWVGNESYPVLDGTFDYTLLHKNTGDGRLEIAEQDGTNLFPGSSFLGWNIGRVELRLEKDRFVTYGWTD